MYITGYAQDALDGQTHTGSQDAFLTKYADDGTKQWTKQLGTPGIDKANGVATYYGPVGTINSTFTAGETYTASTFASKLSTDLSKTVTYAEDSDLTDGTMTFRPYLEFAEATDLTGVPNMIFDVPSSTVSVPASGQLDFRYVNVEQDMTLKHGSISFNKIRLTATGNAHVKNGELQIWLGGVAISQNIGNITNNQIDNAQYA